MSLRLLGSAFTVVAMAAMLAAGAGPAGAQTDRSAAPTRSSLRTPDGQPDIQGFFSQAPGPYVSVTIERLADPRFAAIEDPGRYNDPDGQSKGAIVDPPDGRIPYQPWARARKEDILTNHLNPQPQHLDPVAACLPPGVPRTQFVGRGPFQILQPPGYVVFMYEWTHAYRIIPLDGRPQLGTAIQQWMGDSRGRWEGNTLVVEVTNFNDRAWLDLTGDHHTDAFRVLERWTLGDPDTLSYEATLEDAKAYTRPWKIASTFARRKEASFELLEHACWEGERNSQSILGISSTGNN